MWRETIQWGDWHNNLIITYQNLVMLDHYPPNLRHDIDNQKISVADTKHDAEQHGESVKAKRSSSNGKQKSNTGTEKSTGPPGLKRRPTVAPYMPPKGKFTGTTETKEKLEPKEKPIITLTKTIENLTLSAAPAEFQLQNKQDNVSCSELIGERGINNQSTVAFSEEPPGLRNGNGNTSAATPSSTSTKVQQNVTSQEKDRLVNTNDAQPDDFDHDDWASGESLKITFYANCKSLRAIYNRAPHTFLCAEQKSCTRKEESLWARHLL